MNKKNKFHVVAFSEETTDFVDPMNLDLANDGSSSGMMNNTNDGQGQTVYREVLPGADGVFVDDSDDEEIVVVTTSEEEPQKETNWESDRDVSKFMLYISDMYPAKIPKHDGTSPAACELAIKFLKKLMSEISHAIKNDDPVKPVLPVIDLENNYKFKIMSDIIVLKDYKKKLEKKISDSISKKHEKGQKKKASYSYADDNVDHSDLEQVYESILKKEAFQKEAFTPKLQVVVTPFERAISGIIINSVVAGGKPLEDVFEFLKKKYDLTIREELAIMQVVMDSGFPIFRDRGTISSKKGDEKDGYGVEFIKNYFS